ncbi:MAG: hypothetical protein JSS25_10695 [Proteobacteria bacterium]|nr:hypothetical protein [Pseudomonadota bacterium]
MTPAPGVFGLSRRSWSWLVGVAVLTVAALLSTWVGDWPQALAGDDGPHITTQALPQTALPPENDQVSSARGELAPDDSDAAVVHDLEFLSWYSQRHEAGTPAADVLPELPETMSDGEPPEANDAQ